MLLQRFFEEAEGILRLHYPKRDKSFQLATMRSSSAPGTIAFGFLKPASRCGQARGAEDCVSEDGKRL